MTINDLLSEALQLPPDERLQLADRLFQSVDSEDETDVQAAWTAEIQKRIDDIDAGRVQLIDHDEALRRMLGTDQSR